MCSSRYRDDIVISGVGVTSAIGQGKEAFIEALLEGRHAFGVMKRPGRQSGTAFLGAEIGTLTFSSEVSARLLRTASFSAQLALATAGEAWRDARLQECDPTRIGLLVGGCNLHQREVALIHQQYAGRPHFVRPSYALSFLDTDVCGLCSESFGIRGPVCSIGGASASGHLAILQGIQALQTGNMDACVVVGALLDISFMECQALRSLGAMGSNRFEDRPELACRPFDRQRDGFIYGEACGVLVLEREADCARRGGSWYARIAGWSSNSDGHRNPDPSYEGEVRAIRACLACAGWQASDIDYVNTHGTGSGIGDEIEARAIRDCGLHTARINATKSLTGHSLTAAGAVEIVATVLQMEAGRLHPTRNLEEPIDESLLWVRTESVPQQIVNALSLSMGFGGINSAICLAREPG